MSRTAGQLIDETLGLLQSYAQQPQMTTVTADMSPTDLTFTVSPVRDTDVALNIGVVEIDQELIYVSGVDTTSGTVTVPPWGRGYGGTTAAAHAANTRVTSQPPFPRAAVMNVLNEVLERVYPDVYVVKSFETTTTVVPITYTLPSDAERLLSAKWQEPGALQYWRDVRRFRMSEGLGTQFGDGGRTVDVADPIFPGRPIQFLYSAQPGKLTAETDDFETVTGLGLGMLDVLKYGAASQLLLGDEASRSRVATVEQQNRTTVPPQTALTAARFMEQQFQTRLKEERQQLQRRFPPRITREWV